MEDTACPDAAELKALVEESLPEERLSEVQRHLGECEKCQAALEVASGTQSIRMDHFKKEIDREESRATAPAAFMERLKSSKASMTVVPQTSADDLSFLTPSEKEGLLGKLDSLEVLEVAGRGGMGLVLKAYDPELHRSVAVKVLSPALAACESARERFLREARAAAAIDHENVLPIHTVDRTGPLPYFTMPLVEGKSLQALLDEKESPMPVEQVVTLGRKIASGLAAAHAEGLIHRDIKPANILLDAGGSRTWLADFGLARALEEPSVTIAGTLVGTPQFMAPEQLDDEPPSEQSDLFSLGAVLYYMATGKSAFAAKSTASTIRKVIEACPEPPSKVNPSLPAWLNDLIERLLDKTPSKRPRSAKEVVDVIDENWFKTRRGWLSRLWLPLTGTFLLAAALVWYLRPTEPKPFHVKSNGKAYATLADAIEAATSSDVIELPLTYVRLADKIDFGDKAITLKGASEDSRTVLDFTPMPSNQAEEMAGILTKADLVVERLTFVREHVRQGHPTDPGHAPLIDFRGDHLLLSRCRFELQQDSRTGAPLATVALLGASSCEISDCTFLHLNRGITMLSRNDEERSAENLSLTIRNSSFVGTTSCLTLNHRLPCAIELTAEGNLVSGRKFFGAMKEHAWTSFQAKEIRDNRFCLPGRVRFSLIRVPDMVTFREHFHWEGQGNVFALEPNPMNIWDFPMLREFPASRHYVGISEWAEWSEQVSEQNLQAIHLDDSVSLPLETPLSEVEVSTLLPEPLR